NVLHRLARGAMTAVNQHQFADHDKRGDAERSPHIAAVAAHRPEGAPAFPFHQAISLTQSALRSRSRMMARQRDSTAPMQYIQNAMAMTSMPHSMVVAMLGLLVRLTDAP